MKPVLYRYRDSEIVIRTMDGYTPSERWKPLYDKAAMDAAVAAERERCALVCEEWSGSHARSTGDECTYQTCDFVCAAIDCASAIRAQKDGK